MTERVESILVLEAGGIGDAVMATPALTALRDRFPDARITVVMAPRAVEIVELLDLGFEIRTLRLGRPVWQLVDAARLIAFERGADLLIDLSSIESDRAAGKRRRLVRLLAPRRSLGRNTDERGAFFDDAMTESLAGEEHEIERKLAALAPLGIKIDTPRPVISVPADAEEQADEVLTDSGINDGDAVLGIHPGAFLPTRRWPAERFARLATELAKQEDLPVLITAGRRELGLAWQIVTTAECAVTACIGRRIEVVAGLIRRCRLFVTNDTGMMHVAAAMNVPVVALFGRSNASRYRPWLPPGRCVVLQAPRDVCREPEADAAECRRESCPSGDCMKAISFESVLDAANRLLASTRTPEE